MSKKIFCNKLPIISNNQNSFKRTHIHTLLEEAIKKPAVTVIAGTGFGKTHAVYSFLEDCDVIITWQQLTSLDNISIRFWDNLVNVISLHNEELASNMKSIGFPNSSAKIEMFTSFLDSAGEPGKKHVVVFDDFHLVTEKKILTLFENVINACIDDLCIVLISRNEPEINLTDLVVKDMIFNISEDDLRFSKDDMGLYFETQGIYLSPQTMSKMHENTNGWILAIRLIELSIKQGAPHEEYAIDAMKLNVFKMIENKLFSDIPKKVQRLLIKLSLFQSLPAELVRVLSHNKGHLITEMLKVNSFVRFDSFANIYCIHHLFLDFLKQKQNILTQNEKKECYRSAADWYAQNGYKIDAMNYYGQAEAYENIIDITVSFPYALPEEIAALILDILNNAPKKASQKQPLLIVTHARALACLGRQHEAFAELAELKRKYKAMPKTQKNCSLLCEISIVEAAVAHFCCVFTNDFTFSDLYMNACGYMPQGSDVIKDKYNNHELGAYVCRISSSKKGVLEDYIAAVTACIPYASKVMCGHMYGLDDLANAELAYFRHRIKTSENYAKHALYKASQKGQFEIESRALFYLIRIALLSGDYIKIRDLLKQLDAQFDAISPDNKILYDIIISWFYSTIGLGEKAAGWIKSTFIKCNFGLLVSGIENLSKIKYHFSKANYYDLLGFIENEENIFGIECFLFGKIALSVNKAICFYHLGKHDDALKCFQKAYALAEPNSIITSFIEFGNDMVTLAKFALKNEKCTIPDDWLQAILRKSSTYAKRVSFIASEYRKENYTETYLQAKLTKKELEFLAGLSHGMSIAEIALSHGISKNYVNNRVQVIYSKLGAQNVKDAIHIATSMKLV